MTQTNSLGALTNLLDFSAFGEGRMMISALANGTYVATYSQSYRDGNSYVIDIWGQIIDHRGNFVDERFPIWLSADFSYVPSVATRADGGFIVALGGFDASNVGVFAQRFDAAGTPQGDRFQVNTLTGGPQGNGHIAEFSDGRFVVAWNSFLQDSSFDGVFARLYANDGTPLSDEFQVNTYRLNNQRISDVVALEGGGFVVVWEGQSDGETWGVSAQRYSASATPIGSEFRVNSDVSGYQAEAEVAALSDGGFVVIWRSDVTVDGQSTPYLYGQRFDSDGISVGGDQLISEGYTGRVAALNDGGYVVAWQPDPTRIIIRQYDAAGALQFEETRIDQSATNDGAIGIEVNADGSYLIHWTSYISGEDGNFGRVISAIAQEGELLQASQLDYSVVPDISVGENTYQWLRNGNEIDGATGVTYLTTADDVGAVVTAYLGYNLIGDDGNNSIVGASGEDTLVGNNGVDTIIGSLGNDVLIGGASSADLRDVIYGGEGNDNIDGGYGNDELRGDAGNDTIVGGFGVDDIFGGAGDDQLTGQAWSDLIFGGDGNDFINGGFGYDRVNGGDGADRFFHLGVADHGSDWIQDYDATEGDVLVFGGSATRDQFQINLVETANAGTAGVEEAFIIYRPTGQILWALVDGGGQSSINLVLSGTEFDLLV